MKEERKERKCKQTNDRKKESKKIRKTGLMKVEKLIYKKKRRRGKELGKSIERRKGEVKQLNGKNLEV